MALQFWEEIKKNAKEAADITVKKTTEMTAIAKATVAIKNEESKLSSCYKEIGRLFYTAERDGADYTDEIATFIMQADKIKAAITGYQKEIAALKKVAICESCGSEIPADALFCPTCGTKITKKEEETCTCCCCETENAEETEESCICDCDNAEDTCTCAEDCACSTAEAENTETPCSCEETAADEENCCKSGADECSCDMTADITDAHCCCCEDSTEVYETPDAVDTGEDNPKF